jgi:NhaP-type Na+/H+ or K+/H+ antiporter
MGRFLYLRDPLFLVGCGAYVINRWLVKPHVHTGFLHSHFNDLWLIPCALPPVLWLHRRLNLRTHDQPPQLSEIIPHLLFWSVLFEWIGPKVVSHTTADPLDALAYLFGAIVACLWWQRDRWLRASPRS